MPLTRYEIRNEYSLANPDLYRAAAKDDPEGLLEGVAMAGLVGIVRQLGDLAEFAAEVFHDLHEEVLATAARGHELLIRVQQLEAELPLVEKMMVAESNYVNFAYNPGVEWHANIHNDQNHFTQGDLPRFIRNAYEDCRGPPRLFLLDKFDVAGAGACLKRYTDPSFFRMEWASSELMKAEKEQQDKKARRIKKKGRRQRNGEIRDSFLAAHMQPRMHRVPSEVVENTASTSVHSHIPAGTSVHSQISNSQHNSEHDGLGLRPQGHEHQPVSSRLLMPEQEGPDLKAPQDVKLKEVSVEFNPVQDLKVNEASMEPSDFKPNPAKFDSEEMEMAGNESIMQRTDLPTGVKILEDVADDFASETDNYMDALTTMDSEVETDSEVKSNVELNGKLGLNDREGEATVQSKQATSDYLENLGETDFVTEDGVLSSQNILKESDVSERVEPACVAGSPHANFTEERESTLDDDNCASPSIQQSRASTPISGSSSSTPPLEKSVVKSEEVLESESAEGIPETPETPEANEYDTLQLEKLNSAFQQLPDPAVPLGNGLQTVFPERLGSLSAHLGVKASMLVSEEFSSAHVDKHSFEDSESEASEGMKESSPHSSANSSIQPMKWAIDFSRHPNNVLDSDDELEGMQVSSSSSASSSALSSPRPSTLATTVFNTDFDNKPPSLLSPQGSSKSSSESLLDLSPHSAGSTAPHSPASLIGTGINPSIMSPHVVQTSSHVSPPYQHLAPDYLAGLGLESKLHIDMAVPAHNQSVLADESEHFPPPPPLPPLEWRTTRRFSGILSSSTKASVSSARPPTYQSPLSEPHESSLASKPFILRPLVPQRIPTMPDELVHANKPSTIWNDDSQDFSMHAGELQELSNKAAPAPQNLPVVHETSTQALKSFSAKLPTPSNVPGRLDQAAQPLKASRMGLPASHEVPMKTPEASTTGHPTSPSFSGRSNKSLQFCRSSITEPADDDQNNFTASLAQIEDHNVEGFHASSEFCGSNPIAAIANKVSTDCLDDDCAEPFFPPLNNKIIPSPPRLEESLKDVRPPLPSSGLGSDRVSRPVIGSKVERKDSLIAAIASHDKSMLKKVPEWSQSSRTPRSDDRDVLLEQIRTGSFSLRHTKVEKQEAPRPVTNINVAAILEKANAIRQAFAGSDEDDDDDDWSD